MWYLLAVISLYVVAGLHFFYLNILKMTNQRSNCQFLTGIPESDSSITKRSLAIFSKLRQALIIKYCRCSLTDPTVVFASVQW